MNISGASKALFVRHARDAGNWSGTPLLEITKGERGNLTQLKRAGLLTTIRSNGEEFVIFTPAGRAFAIENGVEMP